MYGLLRSIDVHYDEATHVYLKRWVHFHLNEIIHPNYFCGSWSFGILYPEIVRFFPEMRMQLEDTAERIYEFIQWKALRNGKGVILHNIDLPNIYIDTVYYGGVPFAKLGAYLNRDWADFALGQIMMPVDILRDGDKPFSIHCEENASGKRSHGSWARGNGWVMMASAELLPMLGSTHKARILEIFERLANALQPYQTETGLWRTIIDDTEAYEESSASAMSLFAYRRAQKLGLDLGLGKENLEKLVAKSFAGLGQCVNAEGKFIKTSEGTWPGTIKYYKSLATGEWWWGTGAYLLALSEFVNPEVTS
jgi:rhamnogalacturonyl hydrolase YesR